MLALSASEFGLAIDGARVRVNGRVSARDGQSARIADAFAEISVVFAAAPELGIGDLLVVEGRAERGRLLEAELISRFAAPEPRGDGEVARFAWHGVAKHLVARARATAAVRAYFARAGFLEVETPYRVPAPGVDLHLDALAADGGYLITSPELHMKRLLVAGLPKIFQLARVARRDELGHLHEPEFTLLEWYRAFAGLEEMIADTESLVREVALAVSGEPSLFGADGRKFELATPFQRITVREAFRAHAGVSDAVDLAHTDEARYFALLVEKVEPALARESKPTVLWKYPASQAALARLCPNDPSVAERFELYVGGVELCNGFDELTDEPEQRARFEADAERRRAEGRTVYPLDQRFLGALASGMPASGGSAVGFDRLLMLALGAREISEVIAFPARVN
ncbi:MAG TPA: EF-P lysine aminoacylase EpmA [Polyangiaceae bacterium]|nr:EF-P lysine aminoacylase EpmA [Polyangiaceae bacterium]